MREDAIERICDFAVVGMELQIIAGDRRLAKAWGRLSEEKRAEIMAGWKFLIREHMDIENRAALRRVLTRRDGSYA